MKDLMAKIKKIEENWSFYEEANVSKEKLQEVEQQIISLVGENIDKIFLIDFKAKEYDDLEELFSRRCFILNHLYKNTQNNSTHLRQVNDHLDFLTRKLFERVKAMKAKADLICDDPDFDDDFEIEGTLGYVYNGTDSVLKLEDDEYYGSRFELMIASLFCYYESKKLNKPTFKIKLPVMDDDEILKTRFPHDSDGISFCYMSYRLCDEFEYSLPDLVRLNDFWCEIKFREQSITAQDGFRYKNLEQSLKDE